MKKTILMGIFAGKMEDTERFMGLYKKHGTLRAHVKMMARMELC